MEPGEGLVGKGQPPREGAWGGDEVDHAIRQPGFPVDVHQHVVGQDGGARGFPDHRIAHDGWSRGEVGGDGREVEGGDGQHEAFQGSVVHPVPGVVVAGRLVGVDLFHEFDVVAEEVRRFAGTVDLRLVGVLGLAQHRGGIQSGAVLRGHQAGHLVEDGGPVLPGGGLPIVLGRQGRIDGCADLRLPRQVVGGEHVVVVVGADHLGRGPGADLLATDDQGNIEGAGGLAGQFGLELKALRGPGGVGQNRLVVGIRQLEAGVGHRWLQGNTTKRKKAPRQGGAGMAIEKIDYLGAVASGKNRGAP